MARLRTNCVSNLTNLHRLVLTEEAVCDYGCLFNMDINAVLPNGLTIWQDIKYDCETYISNHKALWYKHYFKLKEIDPYTNEFIYIFIKPERHEQFMFSWKVVGICRENDWSLEDEENGRIRNWIETSLNPKDEGDWVVEMRIRKIEKFLENLYEEDRDEYERIIALFAEGKECDECEIESDGISIDELDRKHKRRLQQIKKQS